MTAYTRLRDAAAAVLALLAFVFVLGAGDEATRAQDGQGSTTFRSSVDVIPVDVQVVDTLGEPITGLTAGQFEVTIGNRKRRVVSADFVDFRRTPGEASPEAAGTPGNAQQLPRVMILVIDSSTLDVGTVKPIITSAQAFVRKLPEEIELGLVTIPVGPRVAASRDHFAVLKALDGVVPHRDSPPSGEFHLSPADVVELSTWTGAHTSGLAQNLVDKICPSASDDVTCADRLNSEVKGQIIYYEGMAAAESGALRSLMTELAAFPYRKTFVLVSGGVVSADMPGGRPDIRELGIDIGKVAAAADVNVYTLFVDQALLRQQSPEVRLARNTNTNVARESELMGRWLDQFSGTAGGLMQKVLMGDGGPQFNRVLAETSAYYLLGVEPAAEDRDGRVHDLKVKVIGKSASIRGRSWVVVPKAGTPARASARPTMTTTSTPRSEAPAPRIVPPTSPSVRELATAFDRDDRAAIVTRLAARDGDLVIGAFRETESPWPSSPRRTAAFALELGAAGVRAESNYTREAALRLLAEYTVRVGQGEGMSGFECAWLRAEVAALEGIFSPQTSLVFADRAVERCPSDARLKLAQAVMRDQQHVIIAGPPLPTRGARLASPGAVDETARRALEAYAAVEGDAATKIEARVRAAWLNFRLGRYDDGLRLIGSASGPLDDRQLAYVRELVRGMLLRSAGQSDAAAAALRAALQIWPTAQSGRVALMTLLIGRGESDEAATLSESIVTAGPEDGDPWWLYWLGDYRSYPALRASLREVAR